MGSAAPLMTLRDLLELKCESSCSDGFRSNPRRLPWHGDEGKALRAKEEDTGLRRSPSRTLSSILFPRSPGSLATVSRLTRSLSRRLVFWRRHRGDDDDDKEGWSDGDDRDSLALPSPVVSSCSASECSEHAESAAEAADPLVPEERKPENPSPSTSSACTGGANDDADHAEDSHKALDGDPVGSSLQVMVDKQQLSPVSVMDFPFHDDDGDERSDAGTCSPSFVHCQHELERTSSSAHEPLHKIRRLDGVAQGVDPVDLQPRFVASDDSGASVSDDTQAQSNSSSASTASATTSTTLSSTDHDSASATTSTTLPSDEQHRSADDGEREPDEHLHCRLLERLLKDDDATAATSERLLLDFLAEGLGRLRGLKVGSVVGTVRSSDDHDESALLLAAKEWVRGAGTQWGVEDVLFAGPAALADMDRERRWMCVGEEEREVGAAVEGLVLDALVAELVSDLAGRC
ncbi:hypothetical protein ACQ4PT_068218 [Festuca glaucescens]